MEQADAESVERLEKLGFNESEARVYVTLLQRQPLTGYELAKISGVPRANVYNVLQKLEQRGAVVRLDNPEGTRYAPVPFAELLDKLRRRYEQTLEQTRTALSALPLAAGPPPIIQFEGYDNLIETAQQVVGGARQRATVAIWPEEARALDGALAQAEARSVDITTLCLAGCREECGACRGRICRYPFGLEESERWLILVADDEELVAGSAPPAGGTAAIRTRQPFLVRLLSWYIRHSITVATLLTDTDLRLDDSMSPETQQALTELLPSADNSGWLEHMRGLLRLRRAH